MNIVIVGGNGFIGSACCKLFYEAGHVVTNVTRTPFNASVEDTPINYIECNYDNLHELGDIYSAANVIIHAAHDTTPSSSASQGSIEINANLLPTLKLLDFLEKESKATLIYLSSGGAVYGSHLKSPFTETSPIFPFSYYGAGKAAIEHFITSYSHQSGNRSIVLRPTNAYGPGQLGRHNFGLVPALMKAGALNRTFELWGDGHNTRDYIYVDDIARLCLLTAEFTESMRMESTSIFNVSAGSSLSIWEMIHMIEETIGKKIDVRAQKARKVDIKSVAVDSTKAREQFGWQPAIDIHEGLQRTWQWYKQQIQ